MFVFRNTLLDRSLRVLQLLMHLSKLTAMDNESRLSHALLVIQRYAFYMVNSNRNAR